MKQGEVSARRSKEEKERKHLSRLSIILLCLIPITLLAIIITQAVIDYKNGVLITGNTKQKIIECAKSELGNYRYQAIGIDINEIEADGTSSYYAYTMSSDMEDSLNTYVYEDSDGSLLNQLWYQEDDQENWTLFVYSAEAGCWVQCEVEEEPFVSNIDTVLDNLDTYTLETKTMEFGANKDECYVFSKVLQNSDAYEAVYEYIYVCKETGLLLGSVTYAAEEVSTIVEDAVEPDEELKITGGTIETESGKQLIMRYEFTYSNDDMRLFDIPTEYITESQWTRLYGSGGDESLEE